MSRPRGFAPWRPQQKTLRLLEAVDEVFDEYAAYQPLTVRQIFYRLVGAHGYEKTEAAYERLCETLNRARRARLVPFEAIRDDGVTKLVPFGFSGLTDFWGEVRGMARNYRRERMATQPVVLELWVEAAGMAELLFDAVKEYGVTVVSSGGFDSLDNKHGAAQRIAALGRETVVLHVGDFDPSGVSIFEAAMGDVSALVEGLGGRPPRFQRVAITPEQIAAYALPGSPPKPTDKRDAWRDGDEAVQVEALPPNVLVAEVRQAVETWVDLDKLADLVEEEARERQELIEALDG